jgi:hypothetical protein
MQPKTIKSKNNGCGTAAGNLVIEVKSLDFLTPSPLKHNTKRKKRVYEIF